MAKGAKKKSVKGDPKPIPDTKKTMQFLEHIQEEIAMVVPDWRDYVVLQINSTTREVFYNIDENCPPDKHNKIKKVIRENADLLNISVSTDDIE
ncbi:MAG: hypothetical protein QM668_21525 [Agriterribacter sp.]